MNDEIKSHYDAVLKDLDQRVEDSRRQLAELQARMKELHFTRQNIQKLMTPDGPVRASPNSESQKYTDLSVRWAILCLLTEINVARSIPEIAEALCAGGIRTTARDFNNNVSAVLSQMKAKEKPEVQVFDGKWSITEVGRGAWSHIKLKRSKQDRRRFSSLWAETPDASTSGVA
jgi:hypothetical protein